jgi:hypothetical protein
MGSATETNFCRLQGALGTQEACPEVGCPFWEPSGRSEGRCVVERLDLSGRADLTSWLIQIRDQLIAARSREEEEEARRLFYRLLDTGDTDGG